MAKKRGRKIFNKEDIAEDWCFECKDGGELMICDYGRCLKAYHPACVGKDDSVLTSDERWICGRHTCLICEGNSCYQCYCCDRAACSNCIGRIDFVQLKGKNGLCNNCLKLALLVEEDRNIDSDGECVDLRDRETYEGLFREYYEIVKAKEKFDKNLLLAGKAQLDKEKIFQISSCSDKHGEEEDEQLSLANEYSSDGETQKKRLKKKRCTQLKTKMRRKVNPKKKEFVGWGSKALIDFLQFIGQDTREKLSPYDVSAIVTKYIKDHNLVHPVKKRKILCDVRLQAVFGKKVINKHRIFSLLESHCIENEEQLQKDELDHDLEDDDTEMLAAPKTEKKVEQNRRSSIWYSTAAQSQFAALIPENIKLVYLKRSLVLEMIKQLESIETKIIGSFVRVKLDPRHHEQRNSHQLVQVTGVFSGIKHGSSDEHNSESLIQVSNMTRGVCLTMLSDNDFSKEECDQLKTKVKDGVLKKITVVELEQRAKILHEDISKHRIARELELLQKLIDRANEKGWRHQLFQHLEKRKLLEQPSYLSFVLQNIPRVIPEEVELDYDNQMHQRSDETTPRKQNIPRVTPDKVELERLSKDEKDVNKMHQCLDETTPTKKNILGVIPEEVELDPMAEDERDGNKMHQCTDETAPTKRNVLGVIPEEVELECLAKDEKDVNQMHQCLGETTPTKKNILGVIPKKLELGSLAENECEKISSENRDFNDGGPQKKRDEKRRCTQQKTKMQRRVASKKTEFVGWGSKSLIDFLRFIGQDTREKLSPYDVTSMVSKYVKEHNLIHPVEKRRILCDVQLEAIFGKKVVNKDRIFSLLESHFVENEERLQKDELDHDLEDDDTEMLVASKTEKKVEQHKRSSIWYSTAAQSQFAALIPENIKLVYLKRSLVLEMIKKPESIETKIIGSFVRVKLDPRDSKQRNSHQLVQITGIKHGSSDKYNSESLIQVSNMGGDVCLTMLSDDEFSKDECDELREKVKAGVLKKITVVELEQKAKILHEDITYHRIARLLEFELQNIPRVIPEEVEVESVDGNDNQMRQCEMRQSYKEK